MTLQSYGPEQFDEFALRTLDLAAILREMARLAREAGIDGIPVHDRKSLEWLANLEVWAHDARARLQTELIRDRGARRARATTRRK